MLRPTLRELRPHQRRRHGLSQQRTQALARHTQGLGAAWAVQQQQQQRRAAAALHHPDQRLPRIPTQCSYESDGGPGCGAALGGGGARADGSTLLKG